MFRRYSSWPVAVAAYNWGPGQIDRWISGGRSFDKLPLAVMRYQTCVLAESALQPTGIGDSALAGIGSRVARLRLLHLEAKRQLARRGCHDQPADAVELLYTEIMRSTSVSAQ